MHPGEPQNTNMTSITLAEDDALPYMKDGIVVGGHRLPWGSNHSFLIGLKVDESHYIRAIYKPRDGERPLRDFAYGTLYKREYLSFLLSRSLGWPPIPLTLIREGPFGPGSFQLYVEHDPETTYFNIVQTRAIELERFAVFDLLTNNADRKAGHFLVDEKDKIWSIDHGLNFHTIFKLRTVMFEFCDLNISKLLLTDLEILLGLLESNNTFSIQFSEMLSLEELSALKSRLATILENPRIPNLDPSINVPWPWV